MGSGRYGAWIVTAGYTLLLIFTAGVATGADDSYGSIQGTVTNGITGERLRKAYVRLAPVSDAGQVSPVVSDAEGRFVFEKVQPGSYSLEAEHQGLMESTYGELKIAGGQKLSDVNISLMPPAVISGRVTDEDGDAWTHAYVSVFRSVWKNGKRKLQDFGGAELNDAGEFRIEHLPSGRYYLSADPNAQWESKNRVASAPQLQETWYPSLLDSSSATPMVVVPGQELTADIRMRTSSVFRIRGKVSGLQGVPVLPGPRAWVSPAIAITPTPGVDGNSKGAVLKPDGSFEVEGVVPGTWYIGVQQGFSPRLVLGSGVVQVVDHDVEDVSLTVQAPHSLKGVVHVEGADDTLPAGLSLFLDSDLVAGYIRGTARPDGGFDFENVPSGRCRVLVRGTASGKYYIKRLRYGRIESPDAVFSVAADGDILEVTLSSRGAAVSGVVRRDSPNGSTAPQVVMLPSRPDDIHLGTVDHSGGFVMRGSVRPGEYTLYAFEGVPEGAWTDPEFVQGVEGKGIRIQVEEGDAKTVEVPLIPRLDIAPLLARLGMD